MSGYRFDKLKLLVVDDNQHMRKLVTTVLQALGVKEISEAPNGEKGLEVLAQVQPDIVFVDWAMTGLTGIDFAKKVRTENISRNPFVPIIMLTGHTSLEHVQEARDAGINEFLAKPVSVKGILTRLVAVIEQPRPFVRTENYFGPCRRRRTMEYQGPERRAPGVFVEPKPQAQRARSAP